MNRGNARSRRSEERSRIAKVIGDYALGRLGEGASIDEIGTELAVKFGRSANRSAVQSLLYQAAKRYREKLNDEDITNLAFARIHGTLGDLMSAYTPLAVGGGIDDDGGVRPPNEKAASLLLQVMDRYGALTNVDVVKPSLTSMSVTVVTPDNAAQVRAQITANIAALATKNNTIQGELATTEHPHDTAHQPQLPPAPTRKATP